MKIQEINARLAGLAVFRGLREDPVLADYAALIRALAQGPALDVCEAPGRFEAGAGAAPPHRAAPPAAPPRGAERGPRPDPAATGNNSQRTRKQ